MICVEPNQFGGDWTKRKLNILSRYLNAFTTALKRMPFELYYIDAFAGCGKIRTRGKKGDFSNFVKGSAQIALEVDDKPFDHLIYIEMNRERFLQLKDMKGQNSHRSITLHHGEANDALLRLSELGIDWESTRGVLFLDPFSTEVEWKTVQTIANLEVFDTWLLFPASTISRMLPISRKPDDASAESITKVFGDDSWNDLYGDRPDLFVDGLYCRQRGLDGIVDLYKKKLHNLLQDRFVWKTGTLRNSRNAVLFELLFFVGSPGGVGPATRIANHLLEHF